MDAHKLAAMIWLDYVRGHARSDKLVDIARNIGASPSTLSRWGASGPKPENVVAFARAYGRPVLEAFIAAGFLTSEDAGEQPSAPPSLASLSDDELLAEVRRRMKGANHGPVDPAEKSPGLGASVVKPSGASLPARQPQD